MAYIIDLYNDGKQDIFFASCNKAMVNGVAKLIHNEISFSFTLSDGKIDIIEGWHIGTEAFTFSKKDGDDCRYYVDYYNPGLLDQLSGMVA